MPRVVVQLISCALLGFASSVHAATAVGRIEGSFAVSDAGQATYTVPIKLTPGIAGMEPKLALVYSSDQDNGILGMGWSLSGLSAITRCSSTIAQDGVVRGVFFDALDKFCLDGQKLRLASGSYGAEGSAYRTEIDGFMRVIAYGAGAPGAVPSTGPQWFSAKTRDGVVIEYGATDDSRIEAQGKTVVRVWAVNKITDAHGNFIEFEYAEDAANGAYAPSVIRYTGHSGQVTRYAVHFDYEARPATDLDAEYLFGSLIKQINRLTAIRLTYNDNEVSRYMLSYQAATASVTQRSRLASITYCAGSECFPPTTFGWSDGQTGWGDLISSTAYAVDDPSATLTVDVNGDGREDLLYPAAGVWVARFGRADGTFEAPTSSTMPTTNQSYAMTLDYDGDGGMDLLQPDGNPGNWQLLRWNGTALQVVNTAIPALGILGAHFTADINGDGLYDVIWIVPKSVTGTNDELHIRVNSTAGFGSDELLATFTGTGVRPFGAESSYFKSAVRRADINADGKTDFFVFWSSTGQSCDPELGCFSVSSNVWQGFLSLRPSFPRAYALGGISSSSSPPFMMDVNGDGNTDGSLVWSFGANNYLTTRISRGDGTYVESQRLHPYTTSTHSSVADWDGDGRDDVLISEPNSSSQQELRVYRSNGTAFQNGVWTGLPLNWTYWGRRRIMDVNGDGMSDLAWYNGTTWEVRLHRGVKPDLLTSVADGFGNATSLVYAPLTAPDVYTKGSGAAAPIVRDYQGPLYVVKTATSSDGIGSTYSLTYSYRGARIHTQGRGFLGFASLSSTDSRNGLTTTATLFQEFPFIGMRQELRVKQGLTTLALTTSTPNQRVFGAGYETWMFPYVQNTVTEQRETNGSLIRTRTVTQDFDDFGNLTDSSEIISDTAGNSFATDVHRDLINDTANWCLGRMTAEAITKTLPDGSAQTRTRTATHDTLRCRVTSMINEPGPLQTTTDFDYDAWGNQNVITVTGAGMAARQTVRDFGPEGQFLTATYNALNQAVRSTWNYALGVESSRTDANNLTVSWQHDTFGRVARETRPDGTATDWTRAYCSVGCGVTNGYYKIAAAVKNAATQQVGGSSHAVFDSLGRTVRESRQLLLGQESHVQTQYDALGRVYRKSAPHFSGGTVFWTTVSYDVLDRVREENHPRGETQPSGRMVAYSYSGLTSTVTDPLARMTTRRENARGEVEQVTDALSGTTRYAYWPFGELKSVTDALGNAKTMTYDARGRKLTMSDPDMGTWSYHHNALGELDTQTDAKNAQLSLLYDALGRLTERYESEARTIWEYDSASGKGIGRIASVRMEPPGGGAATYTEYYVYDGAGRVGEVTTDVADGALYSINLTYDELGRLATVTYPESGVAGRFAVQYQYDSSGMLTQVANAANGMPVYWQANAVNAFGQVTEERLGNNLVTTRDYDLARSLLESVNTGSGSVQNLAYTWDLAGNLTARHDSRQGLAEAFTYDELDRLDQVRLNGGLTLDMGYNPIGNITSKTSVGAYSYGSKPQAVTSAGSQSFTYDTNGNMATRSGAAVTWTSYNLPSQINGANGSDHFSYGPSRSRYRHSATQTLAGGLLQGPQITTSDTVHIGSLYEKVTTTQVLTEHRHHIMVGGRMVAQVTRKLAGDTVYYFHRDHQGSLDAITDAAGQVLARMSFDAFGQRRSPATWAGSPSALELSTIQAITSRGYTGHEMLDASGTIHMNGRVYDPALGRVMSADPTVPDPWNGQAHNRYSYTFNNPLTLVDPSGFEPEDESSVTVVETIPCCEDPPPTYNVGRGGWAWANNPFAIGDAASVGNRSQLLERAHQALRFVMSMIGRPLGISHPGSNGVMMTLQSSYVSEQAGAPPLAGYGENPNNTASSANGGTSQTASTTGTGTSGSAQSTDAGGAVGATTIGAAAAALLGKASVYEAQVAARISLGVASGIMSVGESLDVIQMPSFLGVYEKSAIEIGGGLQNASTGFLIAGQGSAGALLPGGLVFFGAFAVTTGINNATGGGLSQPVTDAACAVSGSC